MPSLIVAAVASALTNDDHDDDHHQQKQPPLHDSPLSVKMFLSCFWITKGWFIFIELWRLMSIFAEVCFSPSPAGVCVWVCVRVCLRATCNNYLPNPCFMWAPLPPSRCLFFIHSNCQLASIIHVSMDRLLVRCNNCHLVGMQRKTGHVTGCWYCCWRRYCYWLCCIPQEKLTLRSNSITEKCVSVHALSLSLLHDSVVRE